MDRRRGFKLSLTEGEIQMDLNQKMAIILHLLFQMDMRLDFIKFISKFQKRRN